MAPEVLHPGSLMMDPSHDPSGRGKKVTISLKNEDQIEDLFKNKKYLSRNHHIICYPGLESKSPRVVLVIKIEKT